MIRSEERDLRDGLLYDPYVKGFDSSFWKGDTANLLNDTVRNAIKVGDTGLVGSVSSYSQYLLGDFEFGLVLDSTTPDSNDSAESRVVGLRNPGDTDQRGAVYFSFSHDTTVGDSFDSTRPFQIVRFDEYGNRQRKFVEWDTDWSGGGRTARFRIIWEPNGINFLVNDTTVGFLSDRDTSNDSIRPVNESIPQALRITNRSLDTTDTNPTAFKYVNVRNARKVI